MTMKLTKNNFLYILLCYLLLITYYLFSEEGIKRAGLSLKRQFFISISISMPLKSIIKV